MSVTAHRITHTFHVDYDIVFTGRRMAAILETEAGDVITTESLLPIEIEFEGDAQAVRAQKIGYNTFIAVNTRITGG